MFTESASVLLCFTIGQALGINQQGTRIDFGDYKACGPSCLYMAAVAKGLDVEFNTLTKSITTASNGEASLSDLEQAAESLGLHPTAAKVGTGSAQWLPTPFIAHVTSETSEIDHFVLVLYVSSESVIYVDPPKYAAYDTLDGFRQRWTGYVLAFANSDAESRTLKLRIRWEWWKPFCEGGLVATFAVIVAIVGLIGSSLRSPLVTTRIATFK